MVGNNNQSDKMTTLAKRWKILRDIELKEEQSFSPSQTQVALAKLQLWQLQRNQSNQVIA